MSKANFFLWTVLALLIMDLGPRLLTEAADAYTVCKTEACKRTARIFKSFMDPSYKPCDNFYNFACGGFARRTPRPANKHMIGPFTDAHETQQETLKEILDQSSNLPSTSAQGKAARFYKSCKESVLTLSKRTTNMNFLKELLNEFINGWPLTSRNWNSRSFDFTAALAKITSQLDQSFFISPTIMPDLENSTKYTLALLPQNPSRGAVPFVDYVIRPHDQRRQGNVTTVLPQQYYSQYQQPNMMAIIREVVCIIDPYCASNPYLYSDVMALNSILTTDGGYSLNNQDMYNINIWNMLKKNEYSYADPEIADMRFTIRRLNVVFPQMDWQKYFTILFQNTNFRVDSTFNLLVFREQVGHMLNAFEQLNDREIALFFGWHIVTKWGPLFSPQLRALLTPGQEQTDVCLNIVNGLMGYAVGELYNRQHVSKNSLIELKGIVGDLKGGFRKLLEENVWMDSITKKHALKKMDNMAESLAAPDWINDSSALDSYYSKISANDALDFLKTFSKGKVSQFSRQVDRLLSVVNRMNDWPIETPAMTNAMYFMPSNSMYFGSGMFQFPFYEEGRPRGINFGSFGYVAGHEITHGFDTNGAGRNHLGEVENWWEENDELEFTERAQCFINQYGSIREQSTGLQLNSRLTIGEDIADNGGIRAAFKAYKSPNSSVNTRLEGMEEYTEDQLFFLSAGLTYCTKASPEIMQMLILSDEHSPNVYRAILPLLNSEDFAKAFNCPVNSVMNPARKCRVW